MIWLCIAICLLVSFTFSGIEAGILSINRVRLRHRVKLGDAAAIKLYALLGNRERLLVTVLLVTNLMNIIAIILTVSALIPMVGPEWAYLLSAIIYLPAFVLGVELLPKSLFRRFPFRLLALLAGVLQATQWLLSPLLWPGAKFAAFFRRQLPAEESRLFCGREDFKYLTIQSEREGALTGDERQMIHNVVDFRTVLAKDVMIPIDRVQCVRSSLPVQELYFLAHKHPYDRFPVIAASGDISGVVNVLDVLREKDPRGNVSHYQRRAVTVVEKETAYSVIKKLRAARTRLAIVQDETRRPIGLVSHEDLIMRLVNIATKPAADSKPARNV